MSLNTTYRRVVKSLYSGSTYCVSSDSGSTCSGSTYYGSTYSLPLLPPPTPTSPLLWLYSLLLPFITSLWGGWTAGRCLHHVLHPGYYKMVRFHALDTTRDATQSFRKWGRGVCWRRVHVGVPGPRHRHAGTVHTVHTDRGTPLGIGSLSSTH